MATKTKGKTAAKKRTTGGTAKKSGSSGRTKTKGARFSMKSAGTKGKATEAKATRPAAKAAAAPKKVATKRKPNPEFMKPMQIKEPLTRIVGTEPLPRTEVTKRVWNYIKEHNLQDQVNRRQINADENLRELFGRDNVTMFEMTAIVNRYLGD